jgi:tetratricopeptide (TPR) repeat protein
MASSVSLSLIAPPPPEGHRHQDDPNDVKEDDEPGALPGALMVSTLSAPSAPPAPANISFAPAGNLPQQGEFGAEAPELIATPSPAPAADPGLIASNLPLPTSYFVGRTGSLARFSAHIPRISNSPNPVAYVLGKAGFGKTELARHFARDHETDFSLRWSIDCTYLEDDYRRLAENLGIDLAKSKTLSDVIRKVHTSLEQVDRGNPYLLIYENVTDIKSLSLPRRRGYCLLLLRQREESGCSPFTCQRSKEQEVVEEMEPLSFEELESLYRKIVQSETPFSQEVRKLLERLDGNPYLLDLALRYLKDTKISIDAYVNKLPKKEKRPPSRVELPQDTYPVVYLTMEKLSPEALAFLSLSIYLDPTCISQEHLLAWREAQQVETTAEALIENLTSTTLIHYENEKRIFSMSPLTRGILKAKEDASSGYAQALDLMIVMAKKFNSRQKETWNVMEDVVRQTATLKSSPLWKTGDVDKKIALLTIIARWHKVKDEFQAAAKVRSEVLELEKGKLNDVASQLVAARSYADIGDCWLALSCWAKAIENYELALGLQKGYEEQCRSELVHNCISASECLDPMGRWKEALDYKKLALQHQLQISAVSVQVADLHNRIATSYWVTSNWTEASNAFNLAYTMQKLATGGLDSIALATVCKNAGIGYHAVGNINAALDRLKEGIEICDRLKDTAVLPLCMREVKIILKEHSSLWNSAQVNAICALNNHSTLELAQIKAKKEQGGCLIS